jgi:hypothetical protein
MLAKFSQLSRLVPALDSGAARRPRGFGWRVPRIPPAAPQGCGRAESDLTIPRATPKGSRERPPGEPGRQ